jgi:hypothetical protein
MTGVLRRETGNVLGHPGIGESVSHVGGPERWFRASRQLRYGLPGQRDQLPSTCTAHIDT